MALASASKLDENVVELALKQRSTMIAAALQSGSHFTGADAQSPLTLPLSLAQTLLAENSTSTSSGASKEDLLRGLGAPSAIASSATATARDIAFLPGSEGQVTVLSLPAMVPMHAGSAFEQPQDDAQASAYYRQKGLHLGSGQVGRYRVHASGRVTLDLQGIPMLVEAGVPRQHHEQIVATIMQPASEDGPASGDFVSLGPVHGHLVASIDLDRLLADPASQVGKAKRRLVEEYESMGKR